jgi:AraC-like DNA-binding protein/ligand-binding sensor protein
MTESREKELYAIRDCTRTFHQVTKLGCILCAPDGTVLYDAGHSVKQCELCNILGCSPDLCVVSRSRAWHEAERFGGKYIYSCPKGLTCIATPAQTDFDTIGYITAGPFLMVEPEDYLQFELLPCVSEPDQFRRAEMELHQIPNVAPDQAGAAANQLFLSVGGCGKANSIGGMLERQNTFKLMGELCEFTSTAKQNQQQVNYPMQLEKEFLQAICYSDKEKAEALLNQLLGHIFFLTGGDFSYIRARISELLVLSARAAIDGGANEQAILVQCQTYNEEMQGIGDIDKLCFWLTGVLKKFMTLLFGEKAASDRSVLPRALTYIRDHIGEHISLDEVARFVHLSPSYFSRLFKSETGQTFSEHLQTIRIECAKSMLKLEQNSLTQIAEQVGFFDQSHFIKAFKQAVGVTPGLYRRRRKRGYSELDSQTNKKRTS